MSDLMIDRRARRAGAVCLLLFPLLLVLVFAMHFHSVADFFDFRWRYVQRPAESYVPRLIHRQNRVWLHDPHVLGYLATPLLLGMALSLWSLARRGAPVLAWVGAGLTCIGTVYMASLFGTWSAFFAIGRVPAEHVTGATEAWRALTAPEGVLLLTTRLACLALFGLAVLGTALWRARVGPRWAAALVIGGSLLIYAFLDLDNWMLIGALMLGVGLGPAARIAWRNQSA
jgi:hypothetical protein